MFTTAVRQMRVAFSTVLGRPFSVPVVQGLVRDALATLEEFGTPGDDVGQLVDGPYADPTMRRELQTRALQRTARHLTAGAPYYRDRFAAAGVDPAGLTPETLLRLPVMTRAELVSRQRDLLCGRPYLSTRSTGSTGTPVEVWLSRQEITLWPALIALSLVLRGELTPDDHVQLSISSRATAAIQEDVELCGLVGAGCSVVGLVPPDEALDRLCESATVLNTYPSYLGALVTAARRRGLGPDDFALHTVNAGGEVLSAALVAAAEATFGARINDAYGATEVLPVGGRFCTHRHLHPDPNMGYAETIDLATGAPAEPGRLGTLVVTPYHPYRECMPVLRYDTRDLVRAPAADEPPCELAAIPGMSHILGKARDLLTTASGPVTPRDVVEVMDALPGARWPVRFAAEETGGRVRVTVPDDHTGGLSTGEIAGRFAGRGIDVEVVVVPMGQDDARRLRPLRCDLLEQTFTRPVPTLVGEPV
ncbi:AMP-binding protein [Dactylosporangium sp. NBC_01737]|uniref:phenylacetate--CoA ligase family protein n=1 Tax=Dactylosporangium sp. NBC_01737 TaxID=2975959 RepID=UPI002E12C35D|nr:AMP-binding protein [Dactylosporangium sp. NBC_01737]